MVNLKWCKSQAKGIKLVEPNENLAKTYLKNAEETLLDLKNSQESNLWKATKKYYCEYFAIYSLLIRIGIKCEIHDCTIELLKKIEEMSLIPSGTYKRLKSDKEIRIDNQYYLKDKSVEINYAELLGFILEIKSRVFSFRLDEIKAIREIVAKG